MGPFSLLSSSPSTISHMFIVFKLKISVCKCICDFDAWVCLYINISASDSGHFLPGTTFAVFLRFYFKRHTFSLTILSITL